MIRLATKLAASSSIITGACLIDFSTVDMRPKSDKNQLEEIKPEVPDTMETIEDIKLFEKAYKCAFVYVMSWGKKHYKVEEFLEREVTHDRAYWTKRVVDGANYSHAKEACKKGETVTLFNGPDKGFVSDVYNKFTEN